MIKKIFYPEFVYGGIKAALRGYPTPKNLRLFGADTETFNGEPHTIQAYNGVDLLFEYVTPATIFKIFSTYLFDNSGDKGVNLCYIHFLRFDSPIIFYEKRLAMYEQVSEIEFIYHGIQVEMLFGKINKITLKRKDRTVHIFDSWSFTQASLANSLEMYKLDARKLEKSKKLEKNIGRIKFNELPKNNPLRLEFEKYAKVDATSEFALARKIMDYHEEYKVSPSISLPQFSARVFRHHFFNSGEFIQFPPNSVLHPAELSYHGGKNGYYLDKPQIIENAYEVDISSAYPYAMATIPQMIKGYYWNVDEYKPGLVGIYLISGRDAGKYPLAFDHGFNPIRGDFENIWTTSFELERMFKASDVRVTVHEGRLWCPDPTYTHNPLAEYVKHFYGLKEKSDKNDPNYYFYKIMLNGLYGKFCQTTEVRKFIKLEETSLSEKNKRGAIESDYRWDDVLGFFVKNESSYRAGSLYNPFIGSLITGFVRGYLYDLEKKYDAFHSATDAVKTIIKPKSIDGLGGLKIETFGRCYAFRNKLYLHFGKTNKYCHHDLSKIKIYDKDGQHLCKFGLHGFKGKAEDLFKARHALLKGEGYDYDYKHMVGLREGFKRKEIICSFIERSETLKLK